MDGMLALSKWQLLDGTRWCARVPYQNLCWEHTMAHYQFTPHGFCHLASSWHKGETGLLPRIHQLERPISLSSGPLKPGAGP